jgi:hypothetical protein
MYLEISGPPSRLWADMAVLCHLTRFMTGSLYGYDGQRHVHSSAISIHTEELRSPFDLD